MKDIKVTSLHTSYDICIEMHDLEGLRHEIGERLESELGERVDTYTSGCSIHVQASAYPPERVMEVILDIVNDMRLEAQKVMALLGNGKDKD